MLHMLRSEISCAVLAKSDHTILSFLCKFIALFDDGRAWRWFTGCTSRRVRKLRMQPRSRLPQKKRRHSNDCAKSKSSRNRREALTRVSRNQHTTFRARHLLRTLDKRGLSPAKLFSTSHAPYRSRPRRGTRCYSSRLCGSRLQYSPASRS